MQYKTITLELIRGQELLYRRLKASRTLLSTMEHHAVRLRERHLALKEAICRQRLHTTAEQASSEAMELAVMELREVFASGTALPPDDTEAMPPEASTATTASHRTQPA